ncbi:MAG: oligosaccharide flippase family protein [Oscillospiraceae bacterium]|nr:oligosaccharide flippase family protein [Oscillospiraceae bacterium]
MKKNKILKDTVFLTAVELIMQGLALIVNVFITRSLGTEMIGIISLIGSFFMFVTIISSGNIYLSASRLISEEIGRKNGNPNAVFRYGIATTLSMSIVTGITVFLLSDMISRNVLKSPEIGSVIRILAVTLPFCSVSLCIKGYFTAVRNVSASAVGGITEFIVKSVLIVVLTEFCVNDRNMNPLSAFSLSVAGGQITGFFVMLVLYIKSHKKYKNKCSISFKRFIFCSVPIFLNSLVTSVLSSANDTLVPITLKQYGNSTSEAFSQFGIFEAIVIPALFFPSSILCSLSGILVPELARERTAENSEKNKNLVKKVLKYTFSFSIFTAMIFLCFGKEIGYLMSGDYFAGKVIAILAPAIPFIYLEIILEGILKGMGKHSFSSLNYLVEYTIRISVLLIFVPLFGFYGIVASYLASNIVCNISRLIMIMKVTGVKFIFSDNLVIPLISAVISAQISVMVQKIIVFDIVIADTVFAGIVAMIAYLFVQKLIYTLSAEHNFFSKLNTKKSG